MISQKTSLVILLSATLLLAGVLILLKPIPQLQNYNHFADQRDWLGIPNAWNVLSNILFALAGIWGLFLLLFNEKVKFIDPRERWLWMGISIGFLFTAIGSGYYHLAPDNYRLFWDRLMMTIVFMSLAAALIGERISINLGLWLWPVLLGIGFYSVFAWLESEQRGNSDLSFYIGVQVFTALVILVMLLSPSKYDRNLDLAVVLAAYLLAILFDFSDHQIDKFSRGTVSGHSLKHLAGGLAGIWLIRMIWKRERKCI